MRIFAAFLCFAGAGELLAQRPLQFDLIYSCGGGRTKLKVISCSGSEDGASCDAQYLDATASNGLGARVSAPRKSLTETLASCQIEKPAPPPVKSPAPAAAPAAPKHQSAAPVKPPAATKAPPAGPPKPQLQYDVMYDCSPQPQRFKVIGCGGGTCDVQFYVYATPQSRGRPAQAAILNLLQFCKVQRTDQAQADIAASAKLGTSAGGGVQPQRQQANAGGFRIGDQVHFMMQPAEVIGFEGDRIRIRMNSGIMALASPADLRRPNAPPPQETRRAPGTPCGSKFEGRWTSTTGAGGYSMEIRNGKAKLSAMLMGEDTGECFVSGSKLIIRKAGEEDLVFDINDDGTIYANFLGEMRKRSK